jgi:hypothetical protein
LGISCRSRDNRRGGECLYSCDSFIGNVIDEIIVDVLGVGDDDWLSCIVGELEGGKLSIRPSIPGESSFSEGERCPDIGISSDDFTVGGSRVDGQIEKGTVIR